MKVDPETYNLDLARAEIKRLQHFENMTKDRGWDNLRETAYHNGCEAGRAGAKKEIETLTRKLGKYKAELLEVYETSHSREASERLVREAVQREREECAKVVDRVVFECLNDDITPIMKHLASRIRARGEKHDG